MSQTGIYVEIVIAGELAEVWRLTQEPALHQRWDLRFSRIEYLPRPELAEPQRFLYETRVGFGLSIDGTGESVGERRLEDGSATSSLRFASEHPLSLIREGSGYWRYVPTARGVRFFTWYDYQPRFGWVGRIADRVAFRPLMGWATAWSFDRLRLWVEEGQTPEASLRFAWLHAVARVTVAFVWVWHGLVPKLWFRDAGELRMLREAGASVALLPWVGAAEVGFGLLLLAAWRVRSLFGLSAVAMALALVEIALRSRAALTAAFNPVTLNVQVIALCVVGWLAAGAMPSAARCRRTAGKEAA